MPGSSTAFSPPGHSAAPPHTAGGIRRQCAWARQATTGLFLVSSEWRAMCGLPEDSGRMDGGPAVESETGEGTAIHGSTPLAPAKAAPGARRPPGNTRAKRRLDILVAEDDAISRIVIQNFLENSGHRTVCVESGKKALEALRLHAFDCLLTDIQMPIMDGVETTRRIREGDWAAFRPTARLRAAVRKAMPEAAGPDTPLLDIPRDLFVAALTAHAMPDDREAFPAKGMDLYLAKPLMPEDLAELVGRIAAHRSVKDARDRKKRG